MSNLYFDERSGDVLGFEVSSGLLGDAAKGTSYLANDEITGVGPELMYVRPGNGGRPRGAGRWSTGSDGGRRVETRANQGRRVEEAR